MSVRKTVLCPYTRWEFDRVEGWCEEMERRGLRLVRFKGQFAVLEDGAPRDTRYRFCAAETGTDAGFKEERQKYADFGWELLENTSVALTENGRYSLARTTDPAAVEMYTDKESFGARASKQLYFRVMLLMLLIVLNALWLMSAWRTGLAGLVEYEPLTLPLLICVPLLLGCLIYSAVRTNRTAKRLEAGELDRGFDPREIRARYIFFIFTAAVIFVAVTTLLLMWIK